jgi:glyoxylase-like metal-dependent hydrolase (beta-lactamase superfamily II)
MIPKLDDAPRLRCHLLDTGYCLAWEDHALAGGRHAQIQCHSLVALLQHPQHGWLLWDTGYHPRILEATATLPYSLYRRITPLFLRPELAVARQLGAFGLKPPDIRLIFVSHFHADHIAGLRDFPDATYVTLRAAYQHVAPRRGFSALRRGFLPMLLPGDFARRAEFPDTFAGPLLPGLGPTCDYFGDGSLLLVLLPGHARGQIGMLAQTESGPVLFAADCCWLSRSIREVRPPARIANFIADSPAAVLDTIRRAHTFAQAHPDVRIVPSHCPEAFAREVITSRPLRI